MKRMIYGAWVAVALGGCQLVLGLEDGQPIPNDNAALANLEVSRGQLEPPFDPEITEYTLRLPLGADDLEVTPTPEADGVSIAIDEVALEPGTPSLAVVLDLGDNRIEIVVTPEQGAPRTYAIAASRGAGIVEQAYTKASNTGEGARFGAAVALDGDTLAIAAPSEDSDATGIGGDQSNDAAPSAGAVYVFVRSGGIWSQQAYIKASNTDSFDQFGWSLALDGDTLAVGAPAEDSSATGVGGDQADDSTTGAGAVYVFVRSGASWSQQAYIKASNPEATDAFGRSVALDGDTLAVGAPLEDGASTGIGGDQSDNSAPSAGAVYVFARTGTSWSQQAYVKASNTGGSDVFGTSVSVDGDTLAVGASGEGSGAAGPGGGAVEQDDDSAVGAGAVYVFVQSGASWSQQAYIKASNPEGFDSFGSAIGVAGDTLAVGAPGEDSRATGVEPAGQDDDGASNAGAVYVFVREDSVWAQQAYLKASNTGERDELGGAVALDGDVVVAGAEDEASAATGVSSATAAQQDNSAKSAGAVYVFTRSGMVWSQQAYVKASNAGVEDQFGGSVAVSGDTVAAGADLEDSGTTGVGSAGDNTTANAGAAYVFQ